MHSDFRVMVWPVAVIPSSFLSLSQTASSRPSWTSSWPESLLRMDTPGWRSVWHQPGLKLSSWPQGNHSYLSLIWFLRFRIGSSFRFVYSCRCNCFQDPECAGREGPKDQRVDRCGPEEVWLPRGQCGGKGCGLADIGVFKQNNNCEPFVSQRYDMKRNQIKICNFVGWF